MTDLSPQEYESLLCQLVEAQEHSAGMMVRARCAPYVRRLAQDRGSALLWSAGCLAGTSYCRVTPTGAVTPCPYLPREAGNVRTETLQQIWESSPVLQGFRTPRLAGKCGSCGFAQGERPVCVGCRARAFAQSGDLFGSDPWCLYQPQQEATAIEQSVTWSPMALERIGRIPSFIRERVRRGVEVDARRRGISLVTEEFLDEFRARAFGTRGDRISHPA